MSTSYIGIISKFLLLDYILYRYDYYLHFSVISGSGSGRVHLIYLPITREGFNFCFNCAINAIATVNPKLGNSLYENIKKQIKEAKDKLQSNED